jgi:protein tyrosine/serine phosphatase
VFVHCRRGADRTGALVGFYRIARNGWSAERAYDEARAIGMRSWYTGLRRQIEEFGASVAQQAPPPAQVAAGH